jgi:hypothetical protein
MLPSAEDSARLFAAANSGAGLSLNRIGVVRARIRRPSPGALAIAALAALGAGGEDARSQHRSPVRRAEQRSSAWTCPS